MKLLILSLALILLLLPLDDLWIESVQASIFYNDKTLGCGPSHAVCPLNAPCCNNGVCHRTSPQACSMSLGCDPKFSHPLDDDKKDKNKKSKDEHSTDDPQTCFPLPVCSSIKETFKHNKADRKGLHQPLIPKLDFTGHPDQAHWTSDFDHIAPYALIDPTQKRLVLKARRDTVKTQSGGGFGATVSSTRWNRYGTFSAKFKSGASGPGIVTAMMLSNPILEEEITFEVTGRNPKTVITDFYRHSVQDETAQTRSSSSSSSWLPSLKSVLAPSVSISHGIRTRTRKLKNMILHKENSGHDDDGGMGVGDNVKGTRDDVVADDSLEASHTLKKSAVDNGLVYKIEWTPEKIQWSVDGHVLRALTAKDLLQQRGYGLPSHPMLLQFTIWDAGHNNQTEAWSGGKTEYGPKDEKEYATLIEWIDIVCHDPKESKHNPWPGVEASKRLALAEKEEREAEAAQEKEAKKKEAEDKKRAKADSKAAKKGWFSGITQKQTEHKHDDEAAEPGRISKFMDALISISVRWMFILVVLSGSASYLTRPMDKATTTLPKDHGFQH